MEVLGVLGDKYGIFLTVLLTFSFLNRTYLLLTLLEVTYFLIVGITIKVVLKQPRPNFLQTDYTASLCAHDYGFPSLHTTLSLGVILAFIQNLAT